MTPPKPIMTPSHLDTVETAKPRRTFHDTAEAFHVTVETSMTPSNLLWHRLAEGLSTSLRLAFASTPLF